MEKRKNKKKNWETHKQEEWGEQQVKQELENEEQVHEDQEGARKQTRKALTWYKQD